MLRLTRREVRVMSGRWPGSSVQVGDARVAGVVQQFVPCAFEGGFAESGGVFVDEGEHGGCVEALEVHTGGGAAKFVAVVARLVPARSWARWREC